MKRPVTTTRRQQRREQPRFPAGMYVGLLTAAIVTLVGVFLGLEPNVILSRSVVSAAILGALTSFGLSVVRMTAAENDKRRNSRR